jgi:hypothetical protein
MNETVQPSPAVRRRRSGAEIAALLSSFAQSGQTPREFCRQRQMPVTSFCSLLHRHAGRHSSSPSLSTTAPVGPGAASLLPVEIVEEKALFSVTKPSSLIVELSSGLRILVNPDFDANTLRRLVAALGNRE